MKPLKSHVFFRENPELLSFSQRNLKVRVTLVRMLVKAVGEGCGLCPLISLASGLTHDLIESGRAF